MEIKEKVLKFIIFYKNKIIITCSILLIFSISLITIFKIYNGKKVFEKEEQININVESEKSKKGELEEKIYVDIKGYVVNPGIYQVNANSRVDDVIFLSGGLLANANTEYINLSKKIFDEMVIVIYSNEEINKFYSKEKSDKNKNDCVCDNTINDACIDTRYSELDISKEEKSMIININTADLELLQTLPGIGEAKAKAIIEYRTTNGNFILKEDLMEISGIGESIYFKIKDLITTE